MKIRKANLESQFDLQYKPSFRNSYAALGKKNLEITIFGLFKKYNKIKTRGEPITYYIPRKAFLSEV
jgi:hypothetical protein